jgi:hypothetical protein
MPKPTAQSAQLASLRRRQVLTGGAIAVGGLAAGWRAHYWDPLEKILAAG